MVLRYSNGIYDCISNHKAVLEARGFCWFGKIGVSPSKAALSEKLNPLRPLVALYCQGQAHICTLLEVSTEKPGDGFPQYYKQFMFDRNIYPKMYFKLGSIDEITPDIFAGCVSLSSKKPLAESIAKSMASFFYGEYPPENCSYSIKQPRKKIKEAPKTSSTLKKPVHIDIHTCMFQENGMCTNKRCISYGFECERPRSCQKQVPRIID